MANKKNGGRKNYNGGTSKARRQAQKQAVEFASNHKKGVAVFVCAVIVILLAAALVIYFCFPQLWRKAVDEYAEYTGQFHGDSKDDDPEGTAGKPSAPVPEGDLQSITTSDFSIHFLELGNKYAGDCTLIKCGDTEVLIDTRHPYVGHSRRRRI